MMDGRARASASPTTAGRTLAPRVRLAVRLGVPLLRLLVRTWRMHEVGREPWQAHRASGRGVVIALWHGQMLPLMAHHGWEGIAVLTSEHQDGEIIARVAEAFGYGTLRGSTSRGGSRALLEIVAAVRAGREIGVTPDGPRGPQHTFSPGALVAAHRAGVPVVGVVAHADRSWRLRSWDRFEIPKPFARVMIAYSAPLPVPGAGARDAAAAAPAFERMMHDLAAQAARAAHGHA